MFKKFLKILLTILLGVLQLFLFVWAFIGSAEGVFYTRKYDSLLSFTKKYNMKKARWKIFNILGSIVLNSAIWKWRYGLGLTDEEPGKIPEPKKSEEESEA